MNPPGDVARCIAWMEDDDLVEFAVDQLAELRRCGFNVAALTITELARRYRALYERLGPLPDGQPAGAERGDPA